MTTNSWPDVGAKINHAMWRDEFAGADGIYDDTGGDAFHLNLPSSGDVATLGAGGKYRLRGFILQVTADHAVTLPAVSSGPAKTYVIGLFYDPAAETTNPVTVFGLQKGTYTATGAQAYVPLYEVTRAAATVLSAATVVDQRAWAASSYYGAAGAAAAGTWPVGARLALQSGARMLRVPQVSGGVVIGTTWQPETAPAWANLTLASGLTGYQTTPQYCRVGREVILRGGIQRSGGGQIGAGYVQTTVATLPLGYRPDVLEQFSVAASLQTDGTGGARANVTPDGTVEFTPAGDGCPWLHLSGVRFLIT